MNGVHDMGGMQGMGPIRAERDEPVFHAAWEKRTFALLMAVDEAKQSSRYTIELIPPATYLRMSYYERWLNALTETLKNVGLVTPEELESGHSLGGRIAGRHVLSVAEVATLNVAGVRISDKAATEPRFHVGESIVARNFNPVGHTRIPRYLRGRRGTIHRLCGVQSLWDTGGECRDIDKKQQHVYSVRFTARELWGEQSNPRDCIFADLWEDYLAPQ